MTGTPATAAPTRLRAEQLAALVGTTVRAPRLSWWLPTGSQQQEGYQIRVEAAGAEQVSDRIESSAHVLVPWPQQLLVADLRLARISVRVWTDLGLSAWSDPVDWELLPGSPWWHARWIGPVEALVPPAGTRPVYELRTTVELGATPTQARVWATAEGVYELFVNGTRVGDHELSPGFTSYATRLQVQRYAIAHLLTEGRNEIRARLSDGWFRGRCGIERFADNFGSSVAFLLQAEIEDAAGGIARIATDAAWRWRTSGATADVIDGECLSADGPGEWQPVGVGAEATSESRLIGMVAPPVRRLDRLAPVAAHRPDSRSLVVDFGQNINGTARLRVPIAAGGTVVVRHAEHLAADGHVTTDHLRGFDLQTFQPTEPGQRDEVAGGPGRLDPHHSTKGFRYVELEGAVAEVDIQDVEAFVVQSDLERTGWFECGDDRLNRLHEALVWTVRSNVCDIPTDCPQRERAGFVGDWATALPIASFLYDVGGFTRKFLADLAAEQNPETGRVATIAPSPRQSPIASSMEGSAAVQASAIAIPWSLWQTYGDRDILLAQYPSMVGAVRYMTERAAGTRHPDRVTRAPQPRPHDRFLLDSGPSFGEWMEPFTEPHIDPAVDYGELETAVFHSAARMLSRVATVLGETADARRYGALADSIRDAWQQEYVAPDGTIVTDTQAMCVQALQQDLLRPEHRPVVGAQLVRLVEAAGMHPATGFSSTSFLLDVLAQHGHPDFALQLLLTPGYPGWLEMLERGATTIWERWDGVTAEGTPQASLNHINKGTVLSFLHEHVGGIRPPDPDDPRAVGYQHIVIEPFIAPELGWARTRLHTQGGAVETFWRCDDDRQVELLVDVPPGATATVRLPGQPPAQRGPGAHRFEYRLDRVGEAVSEPRGSETDLGFSAPRPGRRPTRFEAGR